MKRYDRILIAVLSLAPFISFAAEVDEEISKIFDRRQRQLSSPPKSLRARGASKDDARFQEGLNRVQRRMATTPEEPATDAVDDTADIPAAEGDPLPVGRKMGRRQRPQTGGQAARDTARHGYLPEVVFGAKYDRVTVKRGTAVIAGHGASCR